MQRIARETLGVDAHEDILPVADLAHDEGDVRDLSTVDSYAMP